MNSIKLGREVKCKVTGFKGVATARIEYLNGCFRIGVQAPVDKDGKFPDTIFIDEPQLDYTENEITIEGSSKEVGGASFRSSKEMSRATP